MHKIFLLQPEPDRARFYVAPHVRQAQDEDGLVLLDLRNGRYRTFDPLGAQIWSRIERGYSVGEIVARLGELFGAPTDGIQQDVQTLVGRLLQERLIRTTPDTTENPPRATGRHEGPQQEPHQEVTDEPGAGTCRSRPFLETWLFLRAWWALACMDLSMQLLRFPHLYSVLRRCRTAARPRNPIAARRICRAVDRAASSYLQRAWRLQRSATCAYLLRRNGYPAQMVLGVRTLPFEAHAWVEVGGRVVNDRPELVERYLILDRV